MNVKGHDGTSLVVKEPTELEQLEYFQMLEDHKRLRAEKGDLEAADYVISWTDRFVAKLTGRSVEEVKRMALYDKHKVMDAVRSRLNYLGSSDYNVDF
jgi:hypothetical protein